MGNTSQQKTTSAIDAHHYTYQVRWDAKSKQYQATVAELPECSAASPSQIEALTAVETEAMRRVAAMHTAGIPAPIPLTERRYSGKILLRIPPELHRELSIAAATQHISLNRLIANRLAGGAADEEPSDNQSDV